MSILIPQLCCGWPRVRPMHKSLHSSKSYCESSTHKSKKPKTEESIDLWLRMSQSYLITPYPRQAGLLYDLHLRMLAQRRYNNDILYLKPDSYLISVSTSIRAWSWLFYPEHPICITGDWSEPQTERRGPGLKLSWRHVVAMPYTSMKLLYETPCNFPTSRRKISD